MTTDNRYVIGSRGEQYKLPDGVWSEWMSQQWMFAAEAVASLEDDMKRGRLFDRVFDYKAALVRRNCLEECALHLMYLAGLANPRVGTALGWSLRITEGDITIKGPAEPVEPAAGRPWEYAEMCLQDLLASCFTSDGATGMKTCRLCGASHWHRDPLAEPFTHQATCALHGEKWTPAVTAALRPRRPAVSK